MIRVSAYFKKHYLDDNIKQVIDKQVSDQLKKDLNGKKNGAILK